MSNVVTNETTKVVTKVVDLRHKAPDQAIHELMQAAKDGFAVTKIATRFNHTHVYLETSTKQVSTSNAVGSTKQVSKADDAAKVEEKGEVKAEPVKAEPVKAEPVKAEPVKTTTKKTATKATTAKKVEQVDKDSE